MTGGRPATGRPLDGLARVAADTDVPLRPSTVGGVLRETAAAHPRRQALVGVSIESPEATRRWTYGELLAAAESAATALLEHFEPGERVAVWAPNSAEWVILEFGLALAGLVMVTVNPSFRAKEVQHVLATSEAAGVFFVPEYRGNSLDRWLEEIRPALPDLRQAVVLNDWEGFGVTADPHRLPAVGPGDPLQIQYTSGTTGAPKGVLLRHGGLTNNARLGTERLGFGAGGVWLNTMPMFHISGCGISTLGPVLAGGTQVNVERFEPGTVLRLIEEEGATQLGGVPTMYVALMEHPDFARRDLSSLRTVMCGGAVVPTELIRRIEAAFGATFVVAFGQTESCGHLSQSFLDDTAEDKATTVGVALPHTEMQIVDPDTSAVLPLEATGELWVRTPMMTDRYIGSGSGPALDPEGWLHTGDLCSMDRRGYLQVRGRLKDVIRRGGEDIHPGEVEDVLFAHPAVAEAAVIGVPDERFGEQIVAYVRPAPGCVPDPAELIAHVRANLAPFKTPRELILVDVLPVTASGKVQKFALREQWLRAQGPPAG